MSIRTLGNRLNRAVASGGCDGPPTCVIVRREDRVTRTDRGPCPRCGGRHEVTVNVRRDPDFFARVPA
jgi:hypothetical protein